MTNNQIGICYFIDEKHLEIYSNEFSNTILSIDNIKLSKNKIKKLIKNNNVYVYLNVAFKQPLNINDIDKL